VYVGVNTWRMLEAAAGTVGVKVNGISPAEWLLQTAAANNISVVRMLATGVTDQLPLQPAQGQYNQVRSFAVVGSPKVESFGTTVPRRPRAGGVEGAGSGPGLGGTEQSYGHFDPGAALERARQPGTRSALQTA
jgi:hypothetical protein